MKEPCPSDYGIDSSMVERYANHEVWFERWSLIITNFFVWLVVPLLIYFIVYPFFNNGWYILVTSVLLLVFAATVPERFFNFVESRLPFQKQVRDFRSAEKAYKQYRANKEYEFRKRQVEYWFSLSGHRFEFEVAKLFSRKGWKADVTRGSGDNGVDIIMSKGSENVIVQCKAHKKPVGPHVIRDLYGTLLNSNADRAMLVSLTGWAIGVSRFAADKPIELMSVEQLIDFQKEFLERRYGSAGRFSND